ncbi:p47 [Agrotis segetum granulovirus]|uniref:p47 n=1 Tax=Agrotis segetum granulosis virus TaxID=10464 RepID=A0A0H4BL02_GVAS|nr:p47 [Agrotis segetum granulovirus]AKN63346.1 p47 [Agrotis segetum granulovirus]
MEDESQCVSSNAFCDVQTFFSQPFPQCVKYLISDLLLYWLSCRIKETKDYNLVKRCIIIKEGFLHVSVQFIKFKLENAHTCTPQDLENYVQYSKYTRMLSSSSKQLLEMVLKDRWYKGDMDRLKKILVMKHYQPLVAFLENCLWERGYENNYTLGQQLSIRMTTNLIQSGLDFKHHVNEDKINKGRGWNDPLFEKMLRNVQSVADTTKRYKWSRVYVMLELDRNNLAVLIGALKNNFTVITNELLDNVCLIDCSCDKSSEKCINLLSPLIMSRHVNVLFITDTENYLDNCVFYIYNSMKFYYYCLKNRFVFYYEDYETLYFLFTISALEVVNGGCLNSFTLEKSPIMHPLELNSRRCNALKRAAAQSKVIHNDIDLKVDFVYGKRITTGTYDPARMVQIILKD